MTRHLLLLILPLIVFTVTGNASAAEEDSTGPEIAIAEVLALGPLPIDVETLADSAKSDPIQTALITQMLRAARPQAGSQRQVFGQTFSWQRVDPAALSDQPGVWVWTVTLEAHRFVRGTLQITGLESTSLWLEGIKQEPKNGSLELTLHNGSHDLWIVHRGRADDDDLQLSWQGKTAHDSISAHNDPQRRVSARLLTNAETVNRMAISPDGTRLALAFSGRDDSADTDLRRMEIRELASGRITQSWTGELPSALAWSPDGRWLALRQNDQLWLRDSENGSNRLLLAKQENLGTMRWSPDSSSILIQWTEPFEDKDAKTRRLRGLEDRWSTFRDNAQLFQIDIHSGVIRPLTRSDSSVNLLDIHADGQRVLLSQRIIDYSEAPHSLWALLELSLDTLQTREIGRFRTFNDARYATEGYWLLAGPGLAGGDGAVQGEDLVANEYDGQVYRLSADGQSARSISREFDPAIEGLHRLANGDLILPVTEGDRALVYRYELGRERFRRIDLGLDIVEDFVASEQSRNPLLVARGTQVSAPQQVRAIELDRNRARTLVDTAVGQYEPIQLGDVRDWSFDNSEGDRIDGRYYLPPDFDSSRRYPLIVYYYGGTSPVSRAFTGRYPFHLWASHGYVVYVLQPRGSTGYGQRFSALHVNAWGRYTADDIIQGTEAFVAAHDFVDGERIGNAGASYGGFMTMYLATRTDLFEASISHAGISALTSYWGQGWWGYGYSGIASRDSFPWNNRELYVGQSPVYHADKITTPLLLLTGDSDTNVPPGESHNMFTALKLLGRPVELIEVPGEDHWILDREKRYVWWDTILAWYDYWLKDEPQWWHALYPETAPES